MTYSRPPARRRPPERQWLRAPVSRGVIPRGAVDRAGQVIRGVSIMEIGEARAKGFRIDEETLRLVEELGNASDLGVKMNFGHEQMSDDSIGKFAGRARNFRLDGDRVIADTHIDDSAFVASPEMTEHLFVRAGSDPGSLGTSLVLKMTTEKILDDDGDPVTDDDGQDLSPVARPTELIGSDFVSNPAATTSLLSGANAMASEELTQILDDVLSRPDAPERAMAFLERYMENRPNEDTMDPEVDAPETQEPEKEAKGLLARVRELVGAKSSTKEIALPAVDEPAASPTGRPVSPIIVKPMDQSGAAPDTDVAAALAATVAQQSAQIAQMLSMIEATQQDQRATATESFAQRIDAMVPVTTLTVETASALKATVTTMLGSGAKGSEVEALVAGIESMPIVQKQVSLSQRLTFEPDEGGVARTIPVDLTGYSVIKGADGKFVPTNVSAALSIAAAAQHAGTPEEARRAELAEIKRKFEQDGMEWT